MTNEHGLDILQIMLEASWVVQADLLLLILASVVSWGIIFRKKMFFKAINNDNGEFYEVFEKTESLKHLSDELTAHEETPAARVFAAGYVEFQKLREANGGDLVHLRHHYATFGTKSLERALSAAITEEEEEMSESLTTLASIGSITPFIGLFGTVWGIIDSFASLAQGGATLETVAPGIAEALVATAVGLVAAIPAVWYYNKFGSEKRAIKESLTAFCEKFINEVERNIANKTHE
jgi:biopolymer transport protein TolQ